VGFVAFTDKDLDNLQIGGTIYWGPPPEITYNQAIETWEDSKQETSGEEGKTAGKEG